MTIANDQAVALFVSVVLVGIDVGDDFFFDGCLEHASRTFTNDLIESGSGVLVRLLLQVDDVGLLVHKACPGRARMGVEN